MKKLTALLMTLMLMSTALWADETVTVSANSSDISEGLDLKIVAKLFAEAENLEQFETMLNNPDSAFCNLDLNGDGQVDYLRVIETGEGNKRLIVLQAILAKDIYQDVASIYVVKDESNNVKVQVVGDEYIYGIDYIIEPVYVYRPVIYDWFWGPYWCAWHSPWYWGYYPGWWYAHSCWAHDWYWHHCYAYHHHHYCCSFHHAQQVHTGYRELHSGVTRRDYAAANPERSFEKRNAGVTNARAIRNTSGATSRQTMTAGEAGHQSGSTPRAAAGSRTFGSANTAATRSASAPTSTTRSSRSAATSETRNISSTTSTPSSTRSASSRSSVASTTRSSAASSTRTTAPTSSTRSSYSGSSNTRSSYSSGASSSRSSYSGSSSSSRSSYSGGSSYSSGASSRGSGGGGFSGGGGSRGGGGGGSGATRR